MDDKDFENRMEDIRTPHVNVSEHQRVFRTTLLSTKKSAVAGVLLLLLPLVFLAGLVMKHYLNLDFGFVTGVYNWIGELDNRYGDRSIVNWIIRFLLFFGPLVAIATNLLSILHVHYDASTREIVLSIKVRLLNLFIVFMCSIIVLTFLSYFLVENVL